MKVSNGFDPERNLVIVTITSNLLNKYFANFSGLIKTADIVPKGLTVEKINSNTANILFPLPKDSETRRIDDSKMMIGVDKTVMENLFKVVDRFINTAISKELKTIEFLPLFDYSIEGLKEDVKSAIKNKRNFCFIKSYKDYLESQKNKDNSLLNFEQLRVEYLSPEYCDIAIEIMNGNLELIKKTYDPKLKKVEWY